MIKMWKTINYPIKKEDNNYIQTMDILKNRSINWNDIKKNPNLTFKTIDDTQLMDKYFAERYSQYLNQTQGCPFTIEPLKSLIRTNNLASFVETRLNGSADIEFLNLYSTVIAYLKN